MKQIIKCLLVIVAVLFICTACANTDENSATQEVPESEPRYVDVDLGHFKYSVLADCEVKDTESEVEVPGDKTVVAEDYVIRSFWVSGVPVELSEAVEMLYPEETLEYIEIGKDNTSAYLLKIESADTDGTPMYVYGYHFMDEDVLHIFEVWSYTEELTDEAQAVIQSIEKTYTTLADERQKLYEEDLEQAQQQALIDEYNENPEPVYVYEDSYDYEPYGRVSGRSGRK